MNGKYLLDTNIIIGLFAKDASVIDRLGKASEVFLPVIALGELYYGARKSNRVEENLARITEFAAASTVLSCDGETARSYGEVKERLRREGRPIPENDIWIAALALQHEISLVSRDSHFSEIDQLKIEVW